MKKLLLLFAIAASVFSISCDGVFDDLHGRINPGDQNDFYVAPDGNDNHPGWKAYPMATIGRAIEKATAGDRIHVMAGTYNESVTLKDGVSLYGSYENFDNVLSPASRNVIAHPSRIIAASTTGGIYASGAITQDIVVDSFEIQGRDSTTTSTNALAFTNSGTVIAITVRRCKIISGNTGSQYTNGIVITGSRVTLINNIIIIVPDGSTSNGNGIVIQDSIVDIFNNTIDYGAIPNYWYGIKMPDTNTTGTIRIINNVINAAYAANKTSAILQDTFDPRPVISDVRNNNIVLSGNGSHFVYESNGQYQTVANMETFLGTAASGNIPGYPAAGDNPFLNRPDDYQLDPDSPAASAGQNLYSEGITVDIVGNLRPAEPDPWSIGAYQYQE
ncbi:MAG TPA: DUF1565 domain-containing protein [Spirochaetota bacterium]|nr:DUF1565 domain-containing protein [Spirochaetota bacterium]